MRKLIVFLLITLVTLQTAFAAAGSACRHEPDAGAHHFGHHAHQHRAPTTDQSVSADSADNVQSVQSVHSTDLGQDHDCTTCHANAVTGMPAGPHWPALPAGTTIVGDASPVHLSPPPPARPERPNWSGIA